MFPQTTGTKDFAHEKHTKAPEGAPTGAGTGAVVGGALGWLAGIGALAIPGLGPFIAAGPIMAALAGAGVGGTVGGVVGAPTLDPTNVPPMHGLDEVTPTDAEYSLTNTAGMARNVIRQGDRHAM